MVFKAKAREPVLYYEEKTSCERRRRFCLKPVKLVETKAAKDAECVNILFNRGNKTSINVDNAEEKKIHEHFEFVTTKLQRLHKNVMWNMYIGRSFLKEKEQNTRAQEEVDIDTSANSEFDINNAKTWSKDCIPHIEETLRVNEIPTDGLVCLFSVANDDSEHGIDYDEVAWEIEKVVVYHIVNTYGQRLLNQEGCMARQGMDPISRKVRTPGRNRSGYVVYLAYQLVSTVTFGQVMVETVLYAVDIEMKKKHLLHQLGDLKMSPPVDDRNRKVINDVKEFMKKDQVDILNQVQGMKDKELLAMVLQFMRLIQVGGGQKEGMVGLSQFVTFLGQKDDLASCSSKQSIPGITRPPFTRTNSAKTKQQSSSSLSSCSTNLELSRCPSSNSQTSSNSNSNRRKSHGRVPSAPVKDKRRSNLADILSDPEIFSSSLETLPTLDKSYSSNKGVKSGKTIKEKRKSLTSATDGKKAGAQTVSERPVVVMEEVKKVVNSVKMSRKMKDTETNPKLSLKAIQKKI